MDHVLVKKLGDGNQGTSKTKDRAKDGIEGTGVS